jgi:short-chain fatty acids transporter
MIARVGSVLSRWSSRWVPDPFVLALGLTGVVLIAGAIYQAQQGAGAGAIFWTLAEGWTGGFASTGGLAFALQMCLILVSGHAIATSPPVQRAIVALARVPQSAASATALVTAVACAAAVVHWGLGAIAGALLAREIGRHGRARGLALHYPLLGAAAYAGMAVWHGGLSGSAPLKVAEPGHDLAALAGVMPLDQTLLSTVNLVVTPLSIAVLIALFALMVPRDPAELTPPEPDALPDLPPRTTQPADSAALWLQESAAVGVVIGALGLLVVGAATGTGRVAFDINTVNMLFLFAGMALQGSLRHYVEAIADGARGAGAIILQFPFYFAILGVMSATGLDAMISRFFVEVASGDTFPVVAFWSAGALNLVVPSGGGQWGVQGGILLGAGGDLGVDPSTTVMAFAYGDAWTNMLQPFWALPLLSIMGLRARDIIGYTAMAFLAMGVLVPILLLALG